MDYKRNARYFSKTYARNNLILAVSGGILAAAGWFVYWNIYLGFFDLIVEVAAIAGMIMTVSAISQRPSPKDVLEQIEEQAKTFRQASLEAYKFPADAESCTRLLWGFAEGSTERSDGEGKRLTDRVEFALLYRKKGELAVRRQSISLLAEEEVTVTDTRLSLQSLTAKLDGTAGTLTLSTAEECLILPVFSPDYRLEEFLEGLNRRT